jgi:trehalose 6-phosphate phosphatase
VNAAELIVALRPHLAGALIATDFDGTLAPLVPDPDESRTADGAIGALTALADAGVQIAVITGRDARTVVRLGGFDAVPGVIVAGLYGMETWTGGELTSPPTPPAIEQLRAQLPEVVEAGDPALWIEDKRLSLVVHARRAADPDAALAERAPAITALAEHLGFEAHPGSGVLELRLPGFDKAGALARLADGHDTVLYLGDDLGDLPAFAEIRRMREARIRAYCVGVMSSGAHGVGDACDVGVRDPAAAVALLAELTG